MTYEEETIPGLHDEDIEEEFGNDEDSDFEEEIID